MPNIAAVRAELWRGDAYNSSVPAPPTDFADEDGARPEESAGPQPETKAHKPKDSRSGAEETAKDKRSGLGWLRPGPSEGDRTAAAAEEGGEAKRVVLDEAMERHVDEALARSEAEALQQAAAGAGKGGCSWCMCPQVMPQRLPLSRSGSHAEPHTSMTGLRGHAQKCSAVRSTQALAEYSGVSGIYSAFPEYIPLLPRRLHRYGVSSGFKVPRTAFSSGLSLLCTNRLLGPARQTSGHAPPHLLDPSNARKQTSWRRQTAELPPPAADRRRLQTASAFHVADPAAARRNVPPPPPRSPCAGRLLVRHSRNCASLGPWDSLLAIPGGGGLSKGGKDA